MAWDTTLTNLTDQGYPAIVSGTKNFCRIGRPYLDPKYDGIVHYAHELSHRNATYEWGIRYLSYDLHHNIVVNQSWIQEPAGVGTTDYRAPGLAYDPATQRLWCIYTLGRSSDATTGSYLPWGANTIYGRYSTDGGNTWSPQETIATVSGGYYLKGSSGGDRGCVSVKFGYGGDGLMVFFYEDSDAPTLEYSLIAYHYDKDNDKWGSRVVVDTLDASGGNGGRGADCAVGPSGEAVLIGSNPLASNDPRAMLYLYNPTTGTWDSGRVMESKVTTQTLEYVKAFYNVARGHFDVFWWIYGNNLKHVMVSRDLKVSTTTDMGFGLAPGGGHPDVWNDITVDAAGNVHVLSSGTGTQVDYRYWERETDTTTLTSTDYAAEVGALYDGGGIAWGDEIWMFGLGANDGVDGEIEDIFAASDLVGAPGGENAKWAGHGNIVGLANYELVS